MQNIYDFGKVPYQAAEPIKPMTNTEKITFVGAIFKDIGRVIFLCVPNVFWSIVYLFITQKPKSIGGQTVLITGGGNGIGKALAIRLAKEGCNIAIADLDINAAEKTIQELRNMNITANAYKADIADFDQVKQLKINIEQDIGPVDILINNAGIMPLLSIREGTEEDVERIVKVNITAHFYTVRLFLPGMMQRRRGHIVGLSSMSALHPMAGAVIYSSTKFAVQGFLLALYEELRQEGYGDCIHCTSVHPYFVCTRKDLIEAINLRFPPITKEETANVTVDAILRNEQIVAIPREDLWMTTIIKLLSYKNQQLIRDYILREKGTKMYPQVK